MIPPPRLLRLRGICFANSPKFSAWRLKMAPPNPLRLLEVMGKVEIMFDLSPYGFYYNQNLE